MSGPLIVYLPTSGGGKYHAAQAITSRPACGAPGLLDATGALSIHITPGQERVHPIVCRRCLNTWRKNP